MKSKQPVPQYLLESVHNDLEKLFEQYELMLNRQKLLDSIKKPNVRKEKKAI